jgi:hypothetical protein
MRRSRRGEAGGTSEDADNEVWLHPEPRMDTIGHGGAERDVGENAMPEEHIDRPTSRQTHHLIGRGCRHLFVTREGRLCLWFCGLLFSLLLDSSPSPSLGECRSSPVGRARGGLGGELLSLASDHRLRLAVSSSQSVAREESVESPKSKREVEIPPLGEGVGEVESHPLKDGLGTLSDSCGGSCQEEGRMEEGISPSWKVPYSLLRKCLISP